jgi:DNA mismatch repair protein MutL
LRAFNPLKKVPVSLDIISVLPDSVANQIAAGEVIQRPASAVKELMENAIDAGADFVKLIVKDAGRTLIQVVDDGNGMSATDARLCFERHATSKIKVADDLWKLNTMGFRGEALASIAAVAQVELKSRREEDAMGTLIQIEGTEVKLQEPCAAPKGTSISMKNLFYNVPARRNFLKSDSVEFRHILEEFERIAFANPTVGFSLWHNGNEMYRLEAGTTEEPRASLRQRILALYGSPYNQRLVPLQEDAGIVKISGFVIKPEFTRKTRGEQFFFLNRRFIRNSYLHHAVQTAFDQLLPQGNFPGYFIFLDVDPKTIDVNIHPTKTEVKFEDERSIYAILRSSVKKSLGQYNIAPTLDFEQEMSMEIPLPNSQPIRMPEIKVNPSFNPFEKDSHKTSVYNEPREKSNLQNWETMFNQHIHSTPSADVIPAVQQVLHETQTKPLSEGASFMQLHERYILSPMKNGLLVIDQQRAHERVLYERYIHAMARQQVHVQQKLFPENVSFSPAITHVAQTQIEALQSIGFDIHPFGQGTFVVHGIPAGTEDYDVAQLLEEVLETFRENEQQMHLKPLENIARSLARRASIKPGKSMGAREMQALCDELFGCEQPAFSPDGKPVYINFPIDEIDKRMKRS